jgi:hypothetical protein
MSTVTPALARNPDLAPEGRWRSLSKTLLDRIPLPFAVKVVILVGLVAGEQALEESLVGPQQGASALSRITIRLAVPALVVYMLLSVRLMKDRVIRALVQLRPSVRVDDDEYDVLVRRMVYRPSIVDIGLFLLALAGNFILFVVLDSPPPIGGSFSMPSSPLAAGYIVFAYSLLGWLVYGLLYTGVQHAAGLGRLGSRLLLVNVYDPENLLPFGSVSLLHSLVLAGVIVIPIVMLGRPDSPASRMLIILNTLGSLMTLILPLVGVYRQMRSAKIQTLGLISVQLMAAQAALIQLVDPRSESVSDLNARTTALVTLRKTILESPNWPFRSTTAVVRAVIAAMSPLIYFVLIEVARAYVVPVLIR